MLNSQSKSSREEGLPSILGSLVRECVLACLHGIYTMTQAVTTTGFFLSLYYIYFRFERFSVNHLIQSMIPKIYQNQSENHLKLKFHILLQLYKDQFMSGFWLSPADTIKYVNFPAPTEIYLVLTLSLRNVCNENG